MNPGDLFEFLNFNRQCKPRDEFYDESLKTWMPVSLNVFVFLAHVKNHNLKRFPYLLFFTDGLRLFCTPLSQNTRILGVLGGAASIIREI